MGASSFEYRFRYAIHGLIYTLGFWAPWNYVLPLDPLGANAHTWGTLAAKLSEHGAGSVGTVFSALLILATLFATLGAGLRTWGSAYLGSSIVQSADMHGTTVLADGPYRYLRNPLYLGTILHTLAVALIMPPSGAVFAVVLLTVYQFRLIHAEEPFLVAKLGQPYFDYTARVPRLFPSLAARVPPSGQPAHWLQAALGEIYFIAVAISFATFGWRYNAFLLMKCVIVAFGLSLVTKAAIPKRPREA